MGARGRKSLRGHYEPAHLANVILALAGAQPSDAADAVKATWRSSWTGSAPSPHFVRPLIEGDLAAVLETLITTEDARLIAAIPRLKIILCLDPVEVMLEFPSIEAGEPPRTDFFGTQQAEIDYGADSTPPNLQRVTIIRGPVLLAARALWRDTPVDMWRAAMRRAGILPGSLLDAPSDAQPGTKTAATLPGEAAASRAQTVETERGGGSQPDPTGERERTQSPSTSAPCPPMEFRSQGYADLGNGAHHVVAA
jgi:hypothetical protein